jgi:hypothetical protein
VYEYSLELDDILSWPKQQEKSSKAALFLFSLGIEYSPLKRGTNRTHMLRPDLNKTCKMPRYDIALLPGKDCSPYFQHGRGRHQILTDRGGRGSLLGLVSATTTTTIFGGCNSSILSPEYLEDENFPFICHAQMKI